MYRVCVDIGYRRIIESR